MSFAEIKEFVSHKWLDSCCLVFCIIFLWLTVLECLRLILPWRVNCWFCDSNIWVKYIKRNCWTCPKCQRYNGLPDDADYNRTVWANTEQASKKQIFFQRSLPKNRLSEMCNINQQIKGEQLAYFVPMNERKYYEEIDSYRNTPLNKTTPVISPSKPSYRRSWVADDYWNKKGERHVIFSGSWPSDQSSPVESHKSRLDQPAFRKEWVCGDLLRKNLQFNRNSEYQSQIKNLNTQSFQPVSSFSFDRTPYNSDDVDTPQLARVQQMFVSLNNSYKYNRPIVIPNIQVPHIQIQLSRVQQMFASQNVYAKQQFAPNKIKSASRFFNLL